MLEQTKAVANKTNAWLTGFRTVLTAIAGFSIVFVDAFIGGINGFSMDAVKGAAIVAGLITLKQIKTDIIPRLKGKLGK